MAPTVEEVKSDLQTYQGLSDSLIESAIRDSELFLNGINPDWKTEFPDFEDIWRYAAKAFTLINHFPNQDYNTLLANAKEMISSNWSSSFMQKRKTLFCRRVSD
jgi:hypothetical protein